MNHRLIVQYKSVIVQSLISTDKMKRWATLQNLDSWMVIFKKKHLAIINLAKLVFWSILSSQKWSFAKLFSFYFVSVSGERFLKEREKIFSTYSGSNCILTKTFVLLTWIIAESESKMYNHPILISILIGQWIES